VPRTLPRNPDHRADKLILFFLTKNSNDVYVLKGYMHNKTFNFTSYMNVIFGNLSEALGTTQESCFPSTTDRLKLVGRIPQQFLFS
jgi:hypothetical protein